MTIDFSPVIETLVATRDALLEDLGRIDAALTALTPPVTDGEWILVNREPATPEQIERLNEQFALVDATAVDGAEYQQHRPADDVTAPASSAAVADPPPSKDNLRNELGVEKVRNPHGGRPRVHDYEQIAMWIYSARENGTFSVPALAERFGVEVTVAKNWTTRCRQLGYAIDPPAPATTTPAIDLEGFDLDEVASTYKEAFTVGRRPVQTIIDRYDVTRDTARALVARCRAEGLLPPRDEPPVAAEAPQQVRRHQHSGPSPL